MPPVKKTTRPSGPRSKQGKAKSSLNAISHGLTSTRVMPDEVRMVQDFTHDLTEYYKPESPLEVLQIQRIALCRARLARLADMELAGREVARHLIEIQPERVMAQLKQFSESIKIVALKSIKGQSMLHVLDLDRKSVV